MCVRFEQRTRYYALEINKNKWLGNTLIVEIRQILKILIH